MCSPVQNGRGLEVKKALKRWRVLVLLAAGLLQFSPVCRAAGTNKNGIVPPPRREVPGRRVMLSVGTLYIPDFFKPANGAADVVFSFLGTSWCWEQNFYDARKNAVLVTINSTNLGTLFKDTNKFPEVLDETLKALKPEEVHALNRICLTSFSGGYVATREILKHPEFAARITDVVLADSLYAPRVSGKPNELDSAAMSPFLEFARGAAEGKTRFWFSQLFPPEEIYRNNTTTLAAYYLTDHLRVERRPANETNSCGTKILYRADKGGFHVLGYAGMNNQDHFNHLYGVADLWKQISFDNAAPVLP